MYLVGPLLAFGAILGLAVVLHWTHDSTAGPPIPAAPEDYGLLHPVATVEDPITARTLRRLLTEAEIRCTIAVARDGRVHVLVFEEEIDQARRLLEWMT
jgi:hypothetical protein